MTEVRGLGLGIGLLCLVELGCVARGSGAVTTEPCASAVSRTPASLEVEPTARLLALREQIEEARVAGKLAHSRSCQGWADELTALHVTHGEPYVGARLEAAALLHACGRPEEARERLSDAVEAMPRWARAVALNTLGVLAHERGDEGAALVHLHAALRADPALHEARGNLVRLLLRIYESGGTAFARDDAQRHLAIWLELEPEDPMALVQQARLHMIRARREPAAAETSRSEAQLQLALVLRQHPSPAVAAEALTVSGELLLDEGDEPRALRALRRAVELDPSRSAAALRAAAIMLSMRDYYGARGLLDRAAETVDPNEERTRLRLLAVALRGLRHYDEAAKIYAKLLAVEQPEPLDLFNRAQLELYVIESQGGPRYNELQALRDRFEEVIVAAQGKPEHAEVERRARAEQQLLEREMVAGGVTTERRLDPEAVELEALERKRSLGERERLLKLEAEAKAAKAAAGG